MTTSQCSAAGKAIDRDRRAGEIFVAQAGQKPIPPHVHHLGRLALKCVLGTWHILAIFNIL
jgi:hypothetical protein